MSYITDVLSKNDFRYPDDVARIVQVAFKHGVILTGQQAEQVWEEYSDDVAASWLNLPETDEELWEAIGL